MKKEEFTTHNVGRALQSVRKITGTTQESFDDISSRTYVSAIERGIKTPTLSKVDEFAGVLGVLPLTLLAVAYAGDDPASQERLLHTVQSQLKSLFEASA